MTEHFSDGVRPLLFFTLKPYLKANQAIPHIIIWFNKNCAL